MPKNAKERILANGKFLEVESIDEGQFLKRSGQSLVGASVSGSSGTVTSVNASGGTTGMSFSGGPVTTTGTLTLGGTLNVASGGTGAATLTGYVKGSGTGALTASASVPVADVSGLGTGVATALAVNVGSAGAPVVNGGALGTPSGGTLTNCTSLPVSTGISGLGTGVATALAVNTGSSGAVVVNGGALGTPSSGTVTNLTGTASININGTVGATTPNAGAFTTLSASGAVNVGNSTALTNLTTQLGALISTDTASGYNLALRKSNTGNNGTQLYLAKSRGTAASPTVVANSDNVGFVQFAGYDGTNYLVGAQIAAVVSATPGTNDMPMDLILSTTADGASSVTERMRVTQGGKVFVGSSSITSIAGVTPDNGVQTSGGGNWVWALKSTSASSNRGLVVNYSAASPNDTGNEMLFCYDSTGTRFSVRSNGGVANYQANNVDLSDERVKKDIVPLESSLEKICAIEVVKFKYKDQTHDDYNIGVIAQQVERVAPEFVDNDGFGPSEVDPVKLKAIYQSDLHYAALKAIQELAAQNRELLKRIEALESRQ